MASTKISRTFSSAGNMNKWTISLWLKRAKVGVEQIIASCYENSNYQTQIKFDSSDQLYFNDENNGNTNGRIVSNAKYRDTNGFYHLVFIWDKDNSTSGDKLRMYVNGSRITSFSDTGNAPSTSSTWNASNTTQQFGAKATSDYFDGIMSHIHFCDGYAYEPTEFGETDSTTGEWKIKTSPSVSYGTNGYFWLKDNVATTDNSPNSNTFTASGTLTKTEDCPSNSFTKFNGTFNLSDIVLSSGGTETFNSNSNWKYVPTTLGVSSGKYYCEYKININGGYIMLGVCDMQYATSQDQNSYTNVGYGTGGVGLYHNGEKYIEGSNATYATSYTTNDIVSIALDMDNNKVYFAKNGDWATGSGAWGSSTFNSSTGAITLPTTGGTYAFASSIRSSASIKANFGNGYFGTSQISSEGTNASGIGKFEYDVPTGYTALCTKGLNE